jgi:8-oxo-dGTP pyrophosphatase MutT (NUDIX family)
VELWDLYTENRERTGRTHIRGQAIPEGCFHLVVHVWIRNSRGEYLISQRSANRIMSPLMWECVGGSVLAGEGSLSAAVREVKEEVGIDLSPETGRILTTKIRSIIDGKTFRDLVDIWLFDYDGDVDLRNATTDEVAQVNWMTRREIEELKNTGNLVENLYYFFDKVDTQ